MYLTEYKTLFQYLTIKNLDVHALHGNSFEFGFGQTVEDGGLYSHNLQVSGLFKEQALNTHADTVLCCHILRQFFTILVIELTHEALHYPIDVLTGLTFGQDDFVLGLSLGYQNTFQ
jgi:hypothetical protein